MTKSGPHCMR